MLIIRNAVATDVPLLHTLLQEFAEFYSFPIDISPEQIARDGFGPQPQFRVLIAEWLRQPAGYALFFGYYSSFHGPCLFLEDLFIRPHFRGKGIGKALLSRLAGIARHDAPCGLILQVFEWNTGAVEVYKKLGAAFWNDLKTIAFQGAALEALAENTD